VLFTEDKSYVSELPEPRNTVGRRGIKWVSTA